MTVVASRRIQVQGLSRQQRSGLRLLVAALALAGLTSLGFAAAAGFDEAGVRASIRVTARIALVWFLATFVASSVHRVSRGAVGKWLLRNRKYLGNAFAITMAVHAGFILAFVAQNTTGFFARVSMATLAGGSAGYVVMTAMVVTSFAGPARRLGRRRWKILHKTGMYGLWAIFVFTYLPAALAGSALGAIFTAALGLALALRVVASRRTSSKA